MAAEWTRRKNKLGKLMKMLRERQEPRLTPEEVAPRVKSVRSTITRLESGHTLPNFHFIGALLGIYAATEEERVKAEQLWDAAKQAGTKIEHSADQPAKYQAFRREETEATVERTIQPVAVPGLLQTGDYASAIAEAAQEFNQSRPPGWEDRAAAERHSRRQLLHGPNALTLYALIDEAVIRRRVGGPEVMAGQLRHLLETAELDNVTIQVVPLVAGAYGNMSGPAIILDFDDPENSRSVYLEHAAGGESMDNEPDVAVFIRTFERVSRDVALSPDESAELIKAVLDTLEGQ